MFAYKIVITFDHGTSRNAYFIATEYYSIVDTLQTKVP